MSFTKSAEIVLHCSLIHDIPSLPPAELLQKSYVVPPFTPGGRVNVALQVWVPVSIPVAGRSLGPLDEGPPDGRSLGPLGEGLPDGRSLGPLGEGPPDGSSYHSAIHQPSDLSNYPPVDALGTFERSKPLEAIQDPPFDSPFAFRSAEPLAAPQAPPVDSVLMRRRRRSAEDAVADKGITIVGRRDGGGSFIALYDVTIIL